MRYALSIALHSDGMGKTGDGEIAVELWEIVAHCLASPVTTDEEGDGDEDKKNRQEDDDGPGEAAGTTARGHSGGFGVNCAMDQGSCFRDCWFVVVHALSEV